ncbi:MAG: helix-turn-helix domain-containing protein [Kiritimatiellae bacterium]|nr:helix-turn-helix domain-containing protein [Verrucomicrobiota bacterium]MBU4286370.1 helix-turn-helix domain-containing protein [Verrucomicrobiota bacterium]MBU4366653.1 helix-turn-helix domain-containing protein [Verrucomicrobiota bacterium]MCG2661223.1 helix-turn-helix domain-containing protein [Kiritimatiellia bacterium]
MSAPLENAVRIETEMPVHIPTPDGKAVAETVMVKVPALKDPATGEVYLTGEALEIMDKKKARLMGVLLPGEVKELRARLGLTQLKLSGLLGIGEKTCTRWETGRERPSQSLNLMLVALWEGRLNVTALQALRQPTFSWYERIWGIGSCGSEHKPYMIKTTEDPKEPVTHEPCSLAA